MLSNIAVATLFVSSAMGQYGAPPPPPPPPANGYQATTAAPPKETKPIVYYYADYDNLVVANRDTLYYQSALTQEAVDRTKSGASTSAWSAPKKLPASGFYNATGAVFCGGKAATGDNWGGKYKQVFVADQGMEGMPGAVYGWDVAEDPAKPEAVVLSNKWTVYQQADAKPVDVECGPKDGLFIADKGKDAIYWVTNKDLVAKAPNPTYATVVPPECGAAVAEVRSVTYDAKNEQLLWSNNDAKVENSGVFSYGTPNDATPAQANCVKAMCDAWSQACTTQITKKVEAVAEKPTWAVADAWGKVQVSKGDANVYDSQGAVVAKVAQEATYAEAANDEKRDVVFVADQKAGQVYAVAQGGQANPIGMAPAAYALAYNNGYGWNGAAEGEDSASAITLAAGAVLAALAMFL